jgi:hypothetical protein
LILLGDCEHTMLTSSRFFLSFFSFENQILDYILIVELFIYHNIPPTTLKRYFSAYQILAKVRESSAFSFFHPRRGFIEGYRHEPKQGLVDDDS